MSGEGGIVELNVGGIPYTTSLSTLRKEPGSRFAEWFADITSCTLIKDRAGRFFIDRDGGEVFRHILDYLRNGRLIIPESYCDRQRLGVEADFYQLRKLKDSLYITNGSPPTSYDCASSLSEGVLRTGISSKSGFITVGYQGTLSFGRQGMAADLSFRKINRILVCGKVGQCRQVFGESLNEGRDPDRGHNDRYTARYYLKHTFLEQAFDQLAEAGFRMISSCASGTSCSSDMKMGSNTEEERWAHYNEFVFFRP